MASFLSKLGRLPTMTSGPPAAADRCPADVPDSAAGTPSQPDTLPSSERPSIEALRNRIARIIAREPAAVPRADPTRGELPFVVERTANGPLYVHRVRSGPAARVGRVPLIAARDSDPAMLALLALDPAIAPCDPRRALYLDTETTGLAGGTGTVPFLLGLAWFDEDSGAFVLEQALLRRLGEEAPILALLTERLAKASMIVTYNGKSFDLPLLRTRYVMNRIPAPPEPPHLDLVHMARRIHKGRLKSCTLVAVEGEVLGRERIGDVAGADIVATYAHFLRTGDEEALLGVVEHNGADVLSMVALLGLYGEPMPQAQDGAPEATPPPVQHPSAGSAPPPSAVYAELDGTDLTGVAQTLRRAGAVEHAANVAEAAIARGGGSAARRVRGDIAKARGDKARALADYEALATEVDDPKLRLELAKLYEHHVRGFALALACVERGTSEGEKAALVRRRRLERKLRSTEPRK